MLSQGSDFYGRLKLIVKGQKCYAPLLRLSSRTRILRRRNWRTATAAIEYARAIGERYLRWCSVTQGKSKK